MRIFLRFLLASAILTGTTLFLHAQDAGKVLLLKNGNIMEGDITKIGTQICIRRGVSEVLIDAEKAARICADWDDTYLYMQTILKLDTAAERVKFARWCHLYRMPEKALEQAQKALELQPEHRDAKQLIILLERSLKEPPVKPSAPIAMTPVKPPEPAVNIDVTAETFVSFATRVQPILMNTCASCHAAGIGGRFHLERVAEVGQKTSTRNNLNAVLAYLDLDRPALSPILVKAVTAHGNAPLPPIKDRSVVPFQSLQHWIEQTIACNPQVKAHYAATKPAPTKGRSDVNPATGPMVVSRSVPRIEVAAETKPANAQPAESKPSVLPTRVTQQPLLQLYQSTLQKPLTDVPQQPASAMPQREWCDPDIFNEMWHPKTAPTNPQAPG